MVTSEKRMKEFYRKIKIGTIIVVAFDILVLLAVMLAVIIVPDNVPSNWWQTTHWLHVFLPVIGIFSITILMTRVRHTMTIAKIMVIVSGLATLFDISGVAGGIKVLVVCGNDVDMRGCGGYMTLNSMLLVLAVMWVLVDIVYIVLGSLWWMAVDRTSPAMDEVPRIPRRSVSTGASAKRGTGGGGGGGGGINYAHII